MVGSAFRLLVTPALAAAVLTASATAPVSHPVPASKGYAVVGDTARLALLAAPRDVRGRATALPVGAEISGFLSSRGLPPRRGHFVVTDSGLVFHSRDGLLAQIYPLIGPIRERDGRRWRASMVSLAYTDSTRGPTTFVFRVDGGVFATQAPGPLLDVAERPQWLDSIASREWRPDRPLVNPGSSAESWLVTRTITRGAYADTLYSLFGHPIREAGLVSAQGRKAGRLGEYIASRDSLALDPARMSSQEQLRHAMTHELAHRWQARAPGQLKTLWQGIPRIRDTRRYGHNSVSEHQAEAIAFAIHFLQHTAMTTEPSAAFEQLDQYEMLVPGTRVVARYLALQPVYARHPLRRILTAGVTD